MTRIVLPVGAAAVSVALLFGAAWLGAREGRAPVLPVAATFRAVGVAAVPASARIDVAPHSRRRRADWRVAQHQADGRTRRGEVQARSLVPNGVHRRTATLADWMKLDKQRTRFAVLIRGGTR